MKHLALQAGADRSGYALLTVLVFMGASMIILAGAMRWSSQNAIYIDRNNEYYTSLAAAEGATEKILALISRDYRAGGESTVYANLGAYATNVPRSSDSAYWSGFSFADAQGNSNKTYVARLSPTNYVSLQSQYSGLKGMAATYRVVSNARSTVLRNGMMTGVGQDVQVASIPLFQFAIFYNMDMEINPGPNMTVNGRVHSNGSLYAQPQASLTFQADVTSSGNIVANKKPGDPTSRTPGTITFNGEHDGGLASMNLPIGTNNSQGAVHAVLEIPPSSESITSDMGKQRYYNKADLIILVTNVTTTTVTSTTNKSNGKVTSTTNFVTTTSVQGKSGSANNFATIIPPAELALFVKTNASFYNKREGDTVPAIDIDVAKLMAWSATNTVLRSSLGADVDLLYVADLRPVTAGTEPGVRLINGQDLPPLGLTVATPDPLYVLGHYNAPSSALGTTNTSGTKPASLVADSINILSTAWNDANSGSGIASRIAGNTTVNAAFLAGITVTTNSTYSGGVENFPRFLEDWGGKTFTYNGSMVVMFESLIATASWGGSDVYSPPGRNWAFDLNFTDPTKLPPGTPQILSLIRGRWSAIQPGTTSF